jgi:hypothetical protein
LHTDRPPLTPPSPTRGEGEKGPATNIHILILKITRVTLFISLCKNEKIKRSKIKENNDLNNLRAAAGQGDAIINQQSTIQRRPIMAEPERISPEDAYKKLKAGSALLVCAYEDEDRFRTAYIEGALSFNAFKSKLSSLPKDQEIILYCA